MKRLPLYLFILATAVACIQNACSARRSEPVKGKKFETADARVVNGEKAFMSHCDKCHPAGEAGLGPAINSNPAPQFVKRFQMRHGLGVMPSFKTGEISRADLRDISKYLKALRSY